MKKIYYMMLMAMMSVAMVSCDGWDSPYYVEDIVGSWESFMGPMVTWRATSSDMMW